MIDLLEFPVLMLDDVSFQVIRNKKAFLSSTDTMTLPCEGELYFIDSDLDRCLGGYSVDEKRRVLIKEDGNMTDFEVLGWIENRCDSNDFEKIDSIFNDSSEFKDKLKELLFEGF